ncbi:aminoglycoside phosphotransferase family protein [Saccharopolyspora sp. NPDC002686]|uniref:phosphotransferase enzyme family protein n=1 Tax=Saccharopolyspora sp. NPDC002686 TaxID=3154541 RepID=UPI003330129A
MSMQTYQVEGQEVPLELGLALAEICASVGLDPRGARLIRFINNGVFLLRDDPVIVRVVLSPSFGYRAFNAVEAARWLAVHGIPAVRLLPGFEQPVQVGEHLATLWRYVPELGPVPDGADLGELLRLMHSKPLSPTFRDWQPMADIRRRLTDAVDIDPGDRYFLEQRCDHVEERLSELRFPLPQCVIHADAHLGNVIGGPDGPLLCDLDSLCIGPPEWDLTPLAVGRLRMGHPPSWYEDLAAAYGFDITGWEGFPVLRELRELKITTGVLPIVRSNPGLREQLHRRLRTMRDGDLAAQWAPYS